MTTKDGGIDSAYDENTSAGSSKLTIIEKLHDRERISSGMLNWTIYGREAGTLPDLISPGSDQSDMLPHAG
jgi:hypothetical protein